MLNDQPGIRLSALMTPRFIVPRSTARWPLELISRLLSRPTTTKWSYAPLRAGVGLILLRS